MTIIVFILILALLILVHEFGHFIAAKKNGVLVEEFGIGFPPRLLSIKKGETIYSLNLIPLGGFVKLYGEEYEEVEKKPKIKLQNRAFIAKSHLQKTTILLAGIVGNFILGWLLISYLFTQGVITPTNKVIIESVLSNSPAQVAGLKAKDAVLEIIPPSPQAKPVVLTSPNTLIDLTKKHNGQEITLIVERAGKRLRIKLIPRKNPPAGQGPLGIVISSYVEKKYPWYQAPFYGLMEAANITTKIISELLKTLIQFISLKKPTVEVAGPIGIASYTGQVIKYGKNALLELVALLSLNLAVVNVLPFPALDGGRLTFVVYEWVTKRRMNKTVEKYLNLIGFAILITLAIIISINDIIRIYK